ncbi:hypothetical protein TD95_003083 [Thielaviopsis punctulata]|uniref:C2H2-type domain-containing protein n=1 Tax=Thielaviopsis punctulata TaxID=72032 RepID=A0A0F4ZDM0_9PEZI|nr:hypothetical protein TD95_003083 [Thielaviopsis punctulata]
MQLPNDQLLGYEPDTEYINALNDHDFAFQFTNVNNATGPDFPSFIKENENSASQTPESYADDALPLTPFSGRNVGHSHVDAMTTTPECTETRGRSLISTTVPTAIQQSKAHFDCSIKQRNVPQSATGSGSASGTTSGRSSEVSLSASVQQSSVPTVQSPRLVFFHVDDDENGDASVKNPQLLGAYHAGPAPSIASDMATCHDDASAIYVPSRDASQTRMGSSVRYHGIAPPDRTSHEIESANHQARKRDIEERKKQVDSWLKRNSADPNSEIESKAPEDYNPDEPFEEIPMGNMTENKYLPDQIYVNSRPEDMDQADVDIIRKRFPWDDGPRFHAIESPENNQRSQPESSQAAIALYAQRFMTDNQSLVSVAATTGTFRRRSFPDSDDLADPDAEVVNGSIFKRLSLRDKTSRGHVRSKSGVIFQNLSNLIRTPSIGGGTKRARSRARDEESSSGQNTPIETENRPSPPSQNHSSLSVNTKRQLGVTHMVASVGSSVASIGSSRARHGSISGMPSPKMGLFRLRSRSKSDAGRAASPNLAGLLKQHGGMPGTNLTVPNMRSSSEVTSPSNHGPAAAKKHDESSDEDEADDEDMSSSLGEEIVIQANHSGFQEHIRKLNPDILPANDFLVSRIAQHQVIRYKNLLNTRKRHIQAGSPCNNGAHFCAHVNGNATLLDAKGKPRVLDSNTAGDEEDLFPAESTLTEKSFPDGIPAPPTKSLPAQFECRLCFQVKKFIKPSDWTKHVQEDIQPFTCTWDRCHDSKPFKRKADWVRHENEGHRHLEWWTCDVPDCNHTCYRRDNFLQHLVREHKCAEPKTKTKGQSKRDTAADPTTERVARCHVNTTKTPESEPCRFCGKTFPSWKKLTVHMAKHMEKISFPVIGLAAKFKLSEDTLISPVQDQPRPFPDLTQEEITASFHNLNYPISNDRILFPSQPPTSLNVPLFAYSVNNMNSQFPPAGQPVHMGYGQGGVSPSPLMTNLTPSTLSINTMSSPNQMFIMGQQATTQMSMHSSPAQNTIHSINTTPQIPIHSSPAQNIMHTINNTSPISTFGHSLMAPQSFEIPTSMENFGDSVVIHDNVNTGYLEQQPLYFDPIADISGNMYGSNMASQNQGQNPNQFY